MYLTFEKIIERITYNTDIKVVDMSNNKVILDMPWEYSDKSSNIDESILNSEVTAFGVSDNKLQIEICFVD